MTLPQGGCKKYGSVLNLHILIGCDLVALDRFVRIDSISTHALQVECDHVHHTVPQFVRCFNSRTPSRV